MSCSSEINGFKPGRQEPARMIGRKQESLSGSSRPMSMSERGAKSRLASEIVPVHELRACDRRRMFEVFTRHYDCTSRERFEADLDDKQHALVLRDPKGVLQGFTTITVSESLHEGAPLRSIFSGDTIISREYWGSQQLAFTWIRFAGEVKGERPEVPLYWFLIVKGHRTYRFLPAFSIEFHPHWERPTPAAAKRIMDRLAKDRFGDAYDRETGVVSFADSRGHLKPELAEISDAEAGRPDVAFFLSKNPRYRSGDELVCLTELSLDNLRPIARQQFCQGLDG